MHCKVTTSPITICTKKCPLHIAPSPGRETQADAYAALVALDTGKAVARGGKGGVILIISGVSNTGTKDHITNVSLNYFFKKLLQKQLIDFILLHNSKYYLY